MAKLMTNREMQLFEAAVHFANRCDACVPGLDEGVPVEYAARDVCARLSFSLDEDDVAKCLERITGQN